MGEARIRAIVIALAILGLPVANAGSEQDPEISDAANDAQPATANNYADIVAAWFSDDASKYVAHLKMSQMPANPPPQLYYWVTFRSEPGCAFYFLSYGPNPYDFNQGTQPGFWYGRQDDCTATNDIHRANGVVATQAAPMFTVEMPRSYTNLTFRGDNLTDLKARTIDFASAAPCFSNSNPVTCGPVYSASAFPDFAETKKNYVLTKGPERPGTGSTGMNGTEAGGNETTDLGGDQDDSSAGDTTQDARTTDGSGDGRETPGADVALILAVSLAAFAFRRRK
jgi:hypothetical protein